VKSIAKWLLSLMLPDLTIGFQICDWDPANAAYLSQGRGLVSNLAGLLGHQVGIRARIGAPKTQRLLR
jgi:hypothetical protein